jgi:vacuolar iron transporter family protein
MQTTATSVMAFSIGVILLLLIVGFIANYRLRIDVVIVVASATLAVFGCVWVVLGRAPVATSCARVVIGGFVAGGGWQRHQATTRILPLLGGPRVGVHHR